MGCCMQISVLQKMASLTRTLLVFCRFCILFCFLETFCLGAPVHGWLSWRGPEQTGVSRETGLPDKVSAQDALWVADFAGASAPVIANGKLFAMGHIGRGPDLQEGVACFDP